MSLIRAKAESAKALMQDSVLNETIQVMNEMVVMEIAETKNLDSEARTVLFLKLKLIEEFNYALSAFVDEYETMAQIREAKRRSEMDTEREGFM